MNDFDKDIAEKAQALREQGYSFVEMANMLNVSERQIQKMTVKNSAVDTAKEKRRNQEYEQKVSVVQKYADLGYSAIKIANKTGYAASYIYLLANENNIDLGLKLNKKQLKGNPNKTFKIGTKVQFMDKEVIMTGVIDEASKNYQKAYVIMCNFYKYCVSKKYVVEVIE